jgi:hypothetical protein
MPIEQDIERARQARCVALTQQHRGHGVSTTGYYLGRVLVAQGLRVLLADLTGRHARLTTLMARRPVKNLVIWTPSIARPEDIRPAIEHACRETTGHADVILLDVDAPVLDRAGGFTIGLDFIVAVTEPTAAGQRAADRLAERLHDEQPPNGRVGVVFSRVDAPSAAELPDQTETRHLPVIGYYPADYLLAGGDAYSLKGSAPVTPHDTYLSAVMRIGRKLAQIVPLNRLPSYSGVEQHRPPRETNGQQPA